MKILKKKTKILKFNNLYKIKKNYIKNFQIIKEVIFIKKKIKWILILHALSGSHHSIGIYKKNIKNLGWWNNILSNIIVNFNIITISNLGTTYGSTNNKSKNPFNNKNYNFKFPIINIYELIKIKFFLLKKINIKNIFITIGGSMGGLQSLIWSLIYPKFIKFSICIAFCKKLILKNLILNEISNISIKTNYNYYINKYYKYKIKNLKGLKLTRIIANIFYLSNDDFKKKIFKNIYKKKYIFKKKYSKISNYLNYQGNKFIKHFSPENYIYIINLLKNFNINKTIKNIFNNLIIIKNYFIISFLKDKRFNYKNSTKLLKSILNINKSIFYKIIKIKSGHDSFLIENKIYIKYIYNYIKNINKSEW